MATQIEQATDQRVEQEVHADIYGVSKADLEKKREEERKAKIKADDGGILCTVCRVRGCRIGPMGRG